MSRVDVSGADVSAPAASVVVPSFDRRASVEMVLAALAAQRGVAPGVAPGAFETIVVLDGSTDDSAAMLTEWERAGRLPGLRWLLKENGGQAAARDAGARLAAAPVLIFVDDDVVPEPDLVAHHLALHARGERIAALGDCEIVRRPDDGCYAEQTWAWWEELYASRVRPGRVPCYTDFCAGNVSLRRDDYLASGGFDPAFRGYGGEDYDLGYRLMRDGVRFVSDRRLRAMHHHRHPTYEKLLRARRQEGHADVLLGRKHPELRAGLRLMNLVRHPGDRSVWARLAGLAMSEQGMPEGEWRARLARVERLDQRRDRIAWGRALDQLSAYVYWRGVYEALGSEAAVAAYRAEAVVPEYALDVTRGIPAELPGFPVNVPSDVRVTAGGDLLGTVRVKGPVLAPLRETVADAVLDSLGGALWVWATSAGISLLPETAPGGTRS